MITKILCRKPNYADLGGVQVIDVGHLQRVGGVRDLGVLVATAGNHKVDNNVQLAYDVV